MGKTDKGDEFVAALARLAMEKGILPSHAIECFGKAAAMLTAFEVKAGRVQSTEEGLQFVMDAFMKGIGSVYPVHGTTSVKAVREH